MVNKVKTCVYAIALNEIKHVDLFMQHCKGADLVLVCDTGSTDGTPERLRELGAVVYDIVQKPWRFDVPRNTALGLIPVDIDLCLSIDLDEYLQPGWDTVLDAAWQACNGNIKKVSYDYIWNWNSDGTPDTRFFADKIHHRHGYIWRHPCHETLYWNGKGEEVRVQLPDLVLHHRADDTKSRGQYLHLLKLAVDEDPSNDRMSHYYGRELMFNSQAAEAIEELNRHLNLPTAQWEEERCASARYISRCYRSLNKFKESKDWAHRAILMWPHTREPWLELARAAYADNDWMTCFWAASKCLEINTRTMSYMGASDCWGYEPYDFAALSAFNLQMYNQAVILGEEAIKLAPTNDRLIKNLECYNAAIALN
jgi:tetratricopeptide (TPR) repeat protein